MIKESGLEKEYIDREGPFSLGDCRIEAAPGESERESTASVTASLVRDGRTTVISGAGNGPIDAFCNALREEEGISFRLQSYHEHSLDRGSGSRAVSYIEIEDERGRRRFGVGVDTSISLASFRAVLSALNRLGA